MATGHEVGGIRRELSMATDYKASRIVGDRELYSSWNDNNTVGIEYRMRS